MAAVVGFSADEDSVILQTASNPWSHTREVASWCGEEFPAWKNRPGHHWWKIECQTIRWRGPGSCHYLSHVQRIDVGFILQHGNTRPHTARHTQNFLAGQAVQLLPWPSCSHDHNSIENLWSVLKRRIRRRMRNATLLDLQRVAVEQWLIVHTLIGSMHQRCVELANSWGAYNHYWGQWSINVISIMQCVFLPPDVLHHSDGLLLKWPSLSIPFKFAIPHCYSAHSWTFRDFVEWVSLTPGPWHTANYPDLETISTPPYS